MSTQILGELDYRNVGCAFCKTQDFKNKGPLIYNLPPLNYPGLRDSRVDMRLHEPCHNRIVAVIGAMLGLAVHDDWNPIYPKEKK
jgi:hypothetical protein